MKLRGPMFSLGASGSVAGVVTFASWKGRPYARELVTPSNPRSAGQTANRAMMKFLSQQWGLIDPAFQATWEDLAASGAFSPFNAYVKYNMQRWQQWETPTRYYPADPSVTADAVTTFAAVGGVKQATISGVDLAANAWGALIYRNATTGFTPSKTDVVGVVPCYIANEFTWVDSPVTPGVWYYRAQLFIEDGGKSSNIVAQQAATVTA